MKLPSTSFKSLLIVLANASKVKEASSKIINAEFDINPKKMKDEIRSCKYCKYKDICYMKNEDIVNLETPEDIFGGEINE